MSNYSTKNYLNAKHNQLQANQKDLFDNMNPASFEDMMAYKNMTVEMNNIRNVMKSEFELDHNTKKKILDGFQ
jgi:hypothetical protein